MTTPRLLATALALLPLAGCGVYREATSTTLDPPTSVTWRAIATDADRVRMRNWRKAWDEALPPARKADAAGITREGALFEPDRALERPDLPPGTYRCRTFKLGASGVGMRDFSASPASTCAVSDEGDISGFRKADGAQRPTGLIFDESRSRTIFLGTLVLGDETSPLRYGLDGTRDMIGYVERIGERRWRLVLPYPRFESILDVVELVPA